jgi:hypothetical protein
VTFCPAASCRGDGEDDASPEELAEIFDAFEITASYDKRDHSLDITATVVSELWSEEAPEAIRPATRAGRRTPSIAGAGYGHISPIT